jgi:hypothetical protein
VEIEVGFGNPAWWGRILKGHSPCMAIRGHYNLESPAEACLLCPLCPLCIEKNQADVCECHYVSIDLVFGALLGILLSTSANNEI